MAHFEKAWTWKSSFDRFILQVYKIHLARKWISHPLRSSFNHLKRKPTIVSCLQFHLSTFSWVMKKNWNWRLKILLWLWGSSWREMCPLLFLLQVTLKNLIHTLLRVLVMASFNNCKQIFFNVDLFHMLEKYSSHSSYLVALVKTLSNSHESTTNFCFLVFLVEFVPLLGQILQFLYNKQQLTQRAAVRHHLRLNHFDEWNFIAQYVLSLNYWSKASSRALCSKALKAIEHYEVAVKLGHELTCLDLEKEFLETKLEICETRSRV